MITFDRVLIVVVLIWAFIYTISYGRWTWKEKNKLGAIMLYILAAAVIGLPIYTLVSRG